ncbi:MAG: YceI family protein [Geobacteraceae bacterium]|nr:YceI family protein [Geobacteraceae bacterium]
MNNKISCKELYQWITDGRTIFIIDTLPPEFYESRHIPGARNACIYEMNFLDTVQEITTDKNACIVLYDSSDRSRASAWAAEKLSAIGFKQIHELSGGIEEWEGTGYPVNVVGPELEEEPALSDGVHPIACERSRLEWTGRNVFKKHFGTIAVSGGEITVKDNEITGGSITLDMQTIKNCDLQNQDENSLLIRHLKSDDFFAAERFPTARFDLLECGILVGATLGSPNYFIKGKLTLKEITKEVAIPAIIVPGENGSISAQACFDIDRTEWGVCYGSGKLFERLGMHLVNDTISLELFITTT